MKFIENKILSDDWTIPVSSHYFKWYECMKHTKLGTFVNFKGEKLLEYNQGWATLITPNGVRVTTTEKTVFVKWPNVIGVYINENE